MTQPPASGRTPPAPPDASRRGDDLDLGAVRLPPPLLAAMLPWWMSLGPSALAVLTGRYVLAGVVSASGLLLSTGAAGIYLALSARGGPDD